MSDKLTCTTCNLAKPAENFPWRDKEAGTRQRRCKGCCRKYSRAHYQANQAAYVARARAHNTKARQRNRAAIRQAKDNLSCFDCGVAYPHFVLDLVARGSKKGNRIGALITSASVDRIARELAKFDLVCANCNRIRRYG